MRRWYICGMRRLFLFKWFSRQSNGSGMRTHEPNISEGKHFDCYLLDKLTYMKCVCRKKNKEKDSETKLCCWHVIGACQEFRLYSRRRRRRRVA